MTSGLILEFTKVNIEKMFNNLLFKNENATMCKTFMLVSSEGVDFKLLNCDPRATAGAPGGGGGQRLT